MSEAYFQGGSQPLTFRSSPTNWHPTLFWIGILSLIAAFPVALALILDSRVVGIEPALVKPLKFLLATAFYACTLSAAFSVLPSKLRDAWYTRTSLAAAAFFLVAENLIIAVQAARGVTSHFNDATLVDHFFSGVMAVGAYVIVTAPFLLGIAMFVVAKPTSWRTAMPDPLYLGVAFGLALAGLLGAMTGSALGRNEGAFVLPAGMSMAQLSTMPVVPLTNWQLAVGDLRIAHFFGLHAMQAIPLAALLARSMLADEATASRYVIVVSFAWFGLTMGLMAWAQAGYGYI